MSQLLTQAWETWLFYLPATSVTFGLYSVWLIYGQESILPLDLETTLHGKRLVGGGRGLWAVPGSVLVGGCCAVIQGRGDDALILALGAQFGCLANSLYKRAIGVERGLPYPLTDHIDFVLGASLFYHLQYELPATRVVWGVAVCGGAHLTLGQFVRKLLSRFEPAEGNRATPETPSRDTSTSLPDPANPSSP